MVYIQFLDQEADPLRWISLHFRDAPILHNTTSLPYHQRFLNGSTFLSTSTSSTVLIGPWPQKQASARLPIGSYSSPSSYTHTADVFFYIVDPP
ncbi:unnamed protein product [Nezara viridula]|uniref:Uncharacterized protein n=1 Tax=Nezara viridula TaxID=85310 RepID=A0A9P0HN91_NEZVI|nr:unnamed protein product [Nezara viridula]